MAYSIIGTSPQTSISWRFGDTTLYRFVLDVPPDCTVPANTVVDFVMRTPNGIRVFEESLPINLPTGNLPYFEIFISPRRSFDTPPGNYIFSITVKRPYSGVGNYRYTPLPSAPVHVTGVYSITPDNLIDLDGNTDPPAPVIIRLDCSKMAIISSESPPSPPDPPSFTAVHFTTQPTNTTVPEGETGSLTASAAGTNTFTLQWHKNTTNSITGATAVEGATGTSLQLQNTNTTTTSAIVYYFCRATDSENNVINSNIAAVTFAGVSIPPSTIYYGVSVDTPVTGIENHFRLQDKITGGAGIPFTLNGEGYAYIAYPASWGAPFRINDHNAFNVTSGYTKTDITIESLPYFLYTASNIGIYFGDDDGDYVLIFK